MSVIAYQADSVLTSAVNGRLVDATSRLDSEVGSTANTTSPVYSSGFALAATPVDCFYVKVASRVASPTGTTTFVLRNTTDGSDLASVTINASDIPANAVQGWVGIKFGSVTPNAAKTYAVGFSGSVAGQVTLFRDGTAGNWCRLVRLTTAQAPAAGDMILIVGEITGAGAPITRTVTMDADGSTAFGSLVYGFASVLNWDTTAGVTRWLKLSGFSRSDSVVLGVVGFTGGVCNIGTSSVPFPATSTAIISYEVGANVAFGREMRGAAMSRYGSPKTLQSFVSTDYSAGATSIVITPVGGGTQTGIKSGDLIAIAPGSTNAAGVSACESFTLAVDPVGNTITLPSGLVNDRLNVATYPVEVIVLSCNVQEQGASNALGGYVNVQSGSSETDRYVQTKWMGAAVGGKRCLDFTAVSSGLLDVQNCAFREIGLDISTKAATVANLDCLVTATNSPGWTFSNNVGYGMARQFISNGAQTPVAAMSGNWCFCVLGGSSGIAFFGDAGSTITNNRFAGSSGVGCTVQETNAPLGTCTGNVAHHCATVGARIANVAGGSTSGWFCFKNTNADFSIQGNRDLLAVDNSTFAWSPATNVIFDAANYAQVVFTNCSLKRGLSATQTPVGINHGSSSSSYAVFRNCTIEAAAVVSWNAVSTFTQILLDNCSLPNATSDASNMAGVCLTGSYVAFTRYNGVVGSEKFYRPDGTRTSDTTIFDAGSRSTRIAPNTAGVKLPTHTISVPVNAGQTPTVSLRVRKSTSTDAGGANYTGAQPRLMLRQRYAMGVTVDTVLATYSAGLGAWNTLSATLPAAPRDGVYELYLDCDGTAGWVNVDTLTVTGAASDYVLLKHWTADAAPLPFVTREVRLAGQVDLALGISGSLPKVERRLAATIGIQTGISGAPKVERKLSGSFAVTVGVQGVPRIERKLSGTVTLTISVQGVLRSHVPPIVKSTGFVLRSRGKTGFTLR